MVTPKRGWTRIRDRIAGMGGAMRPFFGVFKGKRQVHGWLASVNG
jgi:hypothetical protein